MPRVYFRSPILTLYGHNMVPYANCKIKACLLLDISLGVLNRLLSVYYYFLQMCIDQFTVMIMNTRRQTY